jgi:DNA-binding transcriptional MerR regulator
LNYLISNKWVGKKALGAFKMFLNVGTDGRIRPHGETLKPKENLMGKSASKAKPGKKLQDKRRLYTQRELSRIFPDVPNKTLIFWAREGLVEWVAERRDARGIARLYNRWNLFQVALVRELAGLGISIRFIRLLMGAFKDFPPERHHSYDEEGNKIYEKCLRSEHFSSEEGLKYKLVILRNLDDRGWQEPVMSFTGKLTEDDPTTEIFRSDMESGTIIIISLSAIYYFVEYLVKEAGLS